MLDATLIQQCADPSVPPALVEKFVEAAGSPDPLAVTVKSGGRLMIVPKPETPEEAMEIILNQAGQAVVRVGLTQFPAGIGIKDAAELKPALVDACENLRMGTKTFAKIMRIVARWYGNPTDKSVLQVFDDAVYAWKRGEFEGTAVFQAPDPETDWRIPGGAVPSEAPVEKEPIDQRADDPETSGADAANGRSEIRIDLSRIGGK